MASIPLTISNPTEGTSAPSLFGTGEERIDTLWDYSPEPDEGPISSNLERFTVIAG